MKYPMLLGLLFVALNSSLFAQEQEPESPQSLPEQLDALMKRSGNYRANGIRYEVIKLQELNSYRQVIVDSMEQAAAHNRTLDSLLSLQIQKTDSIKALFEAKSDLNVKLEKEKNNMAFLGIPSSKSSYRVISWTLILSLLGALLFFIFKFRSSNFLTQQAKSALSEMEQEFEQHRRWALDREQKLSRELLDERNNKKKK